MNETSVFNRRLLGLLFAALFAWGLYLTIGMYRSDPNHARGLMKAAVLLGSVSLFLAFWLGMLFLRSRRSSEPDDERVEGQVDRNREGTIDP